MRLNNHLSNPMYYPLHGLFTDMLRYPNETILFYDADMSETKELARKGHDLNSLVLGPQYQLQADGSTVNIGAAMPVDTINGEKWLRSCGAITNLFGGDTSQARSVSLTSGTVYTLHVFGAGTVSCSYGTANVASPLKITATATAAVTFTPAGATSWMLTATAYPVTYVPPGVTQPATNATATNGAWFKLLANSELWKALDGQPDVTNLYAGQTPGPMNGGSVTANGTGFTIIGTGVASGGRFGNYTDQTTLFPAGYNRKLTVTISNFSGTQSDLRAYTSAYAMLATTPITGNGTYVLYAPKEAEYYYFGVNGTMKIDNISIQRIAPQPLTLATRVRMGVGSGDLSNGTTLSNAAVLNDAISVLHSRKSVDGTVVNPARSYDGTTVVPAATSGAWGRLAIIRNCVQVNQAGTQFRVGYMIEGTHTAIQWSSWAAFDGSFNPSTLYRLMLGLNNTYPMWFNKITAWRKQVTDAEIMEAMA